jgi:transmembrane sensor
MDQNIENQASLWLIEEKEGLSSKRRFEFDIWIKNDLHNEKYKELKNIEKCISFIPNDLKEKLRDEVNEELVEKNISFRPLLFAASILLVAFVAMFSFYNSSEVLYSKVLESQYTVQKNIILPDNTIVSLDAQTKMEIKYFNDKRIVTLLKGTVFFDIGEDKNRPFIIYAKRNIIEDIGTRFEVNLQDNFTNVKVKEGVVKISRISNENKDLESLYVLRKEDSVTLNKYGKISSIKKIPLNKIAIWEDDNIVFDDTPLIDAINKFLKYTSKKVELDKQIYNIKVTGNFKTHELVNFINSLTLIYPIKIEKKDSILYLHKII